MYYKVVNNYALPHLYSSDVVGEARTEYIPGVEIKPKCGPSFCFETEQQAREYLGCCSVQEIWECEGKLSVMQPLTMLDYGWCCNLVVLMTFWQDIKGGGNGRCFSTDALWEGTVFLDTVKLTRFVYKVTKEPS